MKAPKTEKARRTRERIVRESAQIFSVKGFFHTTVDDVLARAGLTKGGFYAHFDSKEALARAVLDHATTVWFDKVAADVARHVDARKQLRALADGYRRYAVDRTFEGGCLFVNLATELDDQDEHLRALLDAAFGQFRAMVATIVELGKAQGAFRADAPADAIGVAFVACLTGTMMQAKAAHDFGLFDRAIAVLDDLLRAYET